MQCNATGRNKQTKGGSERQIELAIKTKYRIKYILHSLSDFCAAAASAHPPQQPQDDDDSDASSQLTILLTKLQEFFGDNNLAKYVSRLNGPCRRGGNGTTHRFLFTRQTAQHNAKETHVTRATGGGGGGRGDLMLRKKKKYSESTRLIAVNLNNCPTDGSS